MTISRRPLLVAGAAALCLALAGCDTTGNRIARHGDYFNTLPARHQELIRQGVIQRGFSQQEVYMAWGSPYHTALSEDRQGSSETWIYTTVQTETRYRSEPIYDRAARRWWYEERPYHMSREYLTRSVTFRDNLVTSWTIYNPPRLLDDRAPYALPLR